MPRRRKDSGFALLLVFLMASLIAISLYMEMPRVAFQAERQREQLLVERGEQYKRAIGLFLRTNKNTRWPASIEELESYNNHRSLRHRYIDPITGKDEWRFIHIQNGVLQDSVTNKKSNSPQQSASAPSGFITELQALGDQGGTGSQTAVNPGLRRRASDGGPTIGQDGQPIQAGAGAGLAGSYPGMPGTPGSALPGVSGGQGTSNGQGGIAGLLGIPTVPGGQTGATGQTNNPTFGGGISGLTGGGNPAQPTVPGAPPGLFNGAQSNGQGLQINPAAQSAAAGLLQNLLTQPRPGGLQGVTGQGGQGGIVGGGIAGVASKAEGESIMVYGARTDFSEWEFIYDPMKFHPPANPASSGPTGMGVPAAQMGSTAGMSAPGMPVGAGPGGTQPSGTPGGIAAGFATGGAAMPGTSAATGATNPAGGLPPAAGGGSSAFGQPGAPDIRPGKK